MLRHLSLFTGSAGGFDFAAELMGWFNIAHVEIDEDCRAILKKNFPYAESYADIHEFDGRQFAGTIDIVSGGFAKDSDGACCSPTQDTTYDRLKASGYRLQPSFAEWMMGYPLGWTEFLGQIK